MVKQLVMNSLDVLSFVSSDDALQMLRGWLRTERQRLRWTQAELARRSGVPAATISRLELTGLGSTDAVFKILFALNRLDAVADDIEGRAAEKACAAGADAKGRGCSCRHMTSPAATAPTVVRRCPSPVLAKVQRKPILIDLQKRSGCEE